MVGQLVDGIWKYDVGTKKSSDGRFRRPDTSFRGWISPEPDARFSAESGRYHLYVSFACPWAHRTLIMRMLKGLEDAISVSCVKPEMLDEGWEFSGTNGSYLDQLFEKKFLREIYTKADPAYTGRVSVPVLWDKKLNTIVSNESAEIIRMLNSSFIGVAGNRKDFAPKDKLSEIEATNRWIYEKINNGVYRCGFAGTQTAYEEAVGELFSALDLVETRIEKTGFLVGNELTEADICLFPSVLRFDLVYVGLFKCNVRRIEDYPNLRDFRRRVLAIDGVAQTVDIGQIKTHYYSSLRSLNPSGIVPTGPGVSFDNGLPQLQSIGAN